MSNPLYTSNRKKYEYNIVFIDAIDGVAVLEKLMNYGKEGWRFVGWTPFPQKSDNLPHLQEAIFERELE